MAFSWSPFGSHNSPATEPASSQQKPANEKADDGKGQDNTGPNDGADGNLWVTPTPENGPDNAQQNANANANTSVPDTRKAAQIAFDEHVASLGLAPNFTPEEIQALVDTRDPAKFTETLGKMGERIYRQAIMDTNRIIESRIGEAVDAAVAKATGVYQTDQFVQKLNAALPFTADADISPVAQGVAAQLVKKGKTPEEAIEGTRRFFKKVGQLSAQDLGINTPPRTGPGSNPFAQSGDEGEDWLDILTGTETGG